jgi:hypothetical protein
MPISEARSKPLPFRIIVRNPTEACINRDAVKEARRILANRIQRGTDKRRLCRRTRGVTVQQNARIRETLVQVAMNTPCARFRDIGALHGRRIISIETQY